MTKKLKYKTGKIDRSVLRPSMAEQNARAHAINQAMESIGQSMRAPYALERLRRAIKVAGVAQEVATALAVIDVMEE